MATGILPCIAVHARFRYCDLHYGHWDVTSNITYRRDHESSLFIPSYEIPSPRFRPLLCTRLIFLRLQLLGRCFRSADVWL